MTRQSDIYTWEMTTEGWDMTKKKKDNNGEMCHGDKSHNNNKQ